MKKETNKTSLFSANEFQLRYFFLDMTQGVFKYGKQPNSNQTVIHFRDIISMEEAPLGPRSVDRNY